MNKDETENMPGTQKEQHMSNDELGRCKAARRALLERVAKQPAMNLGRFSRDEAYER